MAIKSTTIPLRKEQGATPTTWRGQPLAWRQRRANSLLVLIAYGLALLTLLVLLQQALTLGQRTLDDVRYGFPRRVAIQGIVGHGDTDHPTLIVAVNSDGQPAVIELPGGDATKAVALPAPYLVGRHNAYVVPQLALRDVDGDGYLDLVLTLDGEQVIYLNKDGVFRLITDVEREAILTAMPQH